jgi:hypothetical protein
MCGQQDRGRIKIQIAKVPGHFLANVVRPSPVKVVQERCRL